MMKLDHDLGNGILLGDVLMAIHHYVYPGDYENRPSEEDIRKNGIEILKKLEYPRNVAGKTEW